MDCPNCGIINYDSAVWCNCGYNFETNFYMSSGLIVLLNSFFGLIGYPLKCHKCGKHYRIKDNICKCGYIPTEKRLRSLISLSTKTSDTCEKVNIDRINLIRHKCINETESTSGYSTRIACWNLSSERRERIFQLRCDFVVPDQFHVSQFMWEPDNQLFDEWVTIGGKHYQSAGGLWTLTGNKQHLRDCIERNKSFLLNNLLMLLRKEKYISSDIYQYQDSKIFGSQI